MNLTQLVYVSKASQLMGMLSLTRILDSSVCQLLEGHKYEILAVWDRISSDKRHHILRRLDLTSIQKRSYPNWKLRFYGAEQIARHFKHMAGILDGMPEHDHELLKIMRNIIVE